MDKYVRNDDKNDDMGVYNHNEDLSGLSVIKSYNNNRPLKVRGKNKISDKEAYGRVTKAQAKLSPRELELMKLVIEEGLSIRESSARMNISQPMAQKYWNRIRGKLK